MNARPPRRPMTHGFLLVVLISLACPGAPEEPGTGGPVEPLPEQPQEPANSIPTQLVFFTQPGTADTGSLMAPIEIKALDASGNPVPGVSVSIALETNPSQGILSGRSTTPTDAKGVASFPDLRIDSRGTGYTLVASAEPAGAAVLVTVSSPFNVLQVDQQQPITSEPESYVGGSSQQKLAQVVTAESSGYLSEVALPVRCGSGELLIEIQGVTSDQPNGTLLAVRTVPYTEMSMTPGFKRFSFPWPAAFSKGSRYAIILSSSGTCTMSSGPVGNPYLGGDGFFDARPNPPGKWVPMGLGTGQMDLPFQAFMR